MNHPVKIAPSQRVGITRRHACKLGVAGAWYCSTAQASPDPIEYSGFVRIGGIDQWIDIRGTTADNPPSSFISTAALGEAQSPFLKLILLPWERDYTIVSWDQRGAGKTFAKNGMATPNLTLDRLVNDAMEVAALARRRLSKRKVILVGQSWGSFLGVHVAKRKPDLFYAFVGTGQVVDFVKGVDERMKQGRLQAAQEGDQDALKAINKAAALPADRRIMAELDATHKWRMSPDDENFAKMFYAFIGNKPYKGDAAGWMAGAEFSANKLKDVMFSMNVRSLGLDMPLPFFVIEGRDDRITPFDLARDYLRDVRAPIKAFVPIDGGHYACFTNPHAFVAALNEKVRPIAA